MQNPADRLTIIAILVSVSFVTAFVMTPFLVHDTQLKSPGNVKPFCPEFSRWLENPRYEPWSNEADHHGLGLIPGPVSLVRISPETSPGIPKSWNLIFPVLSAPPAKLSSFHSAFFSSV